MGLFNWSVTFFLLLAASLLSQDRDRYGRMALAALLVGVHGSLCLLPKLFFLKDTWCRILVLGLTGIGAYRERKNQKTLLFLLLELSMTAFAVGAERGLSAGFVILGGIGVFGLVFLSKKAPKTVSMELTYGDRTVPITALRDTGNLLTDPITGQPVLVIGPKAAEDLTGLKKAHLQDPLGTLGSGVRQGLRLIPYHTISQPAGMLLALTVEQRRPGTKGETVLVAFAPEELDKDGRINGLIGGSV